MPSVQYQFDSTGVMVSNLILNEQHPVTELNYKDYFFIVPYFAPFYITNLEVKLLVGTEVRLLTQGVDYYPTLPYTGATRSIGIPLYGGISLNRQYTDGIVSIDYQTIGGDWIADHEYVVTLLSEQVYNPRITYWDLVTNKTNEFPPITHSHDVQLALYGHDTLVKAINDIVNSITVGPGSEYLSHLRDINNPHKVTKDQIELGNVLNYTVADPTSVLDDTANNLYTTPSLVHFLIRKYINENVTPLVDTSIDLALSKLVDETGKVRSELTDYIDKEIADLKLETTNDLSALKIEILEIVSENEDASHAIINKSISDLHGILTPQINDIAKSVDYNHTAVLEQLDLTIGELTRGLTSDELTHVGLDAYWFYTRPCHRNESYSLSLVTSVASIPDTRIPEQRLLLLTQLSDTIKQMILGHTPLTTSDVILINSTMSILNNDLIDLTDKFNLLKNTTLPSLVDTLNKNLSDGIKDTVALVNESINSLGDLIANPSQLNKVSFSNLDAEYMYCFTNRSKLTLCYSDLVIIEIPSTNSLPVDTQLAIELVANNIINLVNVKFGELSAQLSVNSNNLTRQIEQLSSDLSDLDIRLTNHINNP